MILTIRTHCTNLKKKGAAIKVTEVEEINTLHESPRDGGDGVERSLEQSAGGWSRAMTTGRRKAIKSLILTWT